MSVLSKVHGSSLTHLVATIELLVDGWYTLGAVTPDCLAVLSCLMGRIMVENRESLPHMCVDKGIETKSNLDYDWSHGALLLYIQHAKHFKPSRQVDLKWNTIRSTLSTKAPALENSKDLALVSQVSHCYLHDWKHFMSCHFIPTKTHIRSSPCCGNALCLGRRVKGKHHRKQQQQQQQLKKLFKITSNHISNSRFKYKPSWRFGRYIFLLKRQKNLWRLYYLPNRSIQCNHIAAVIQSRFHQSCHHAVAP